MTARKIIKYGIFYPAVGVLWVFAIFLVLELLALGTELWREHHNPLLVALKKQQPLPLRAPSIATDNDEVMGPGGWDNNSTIVTTDFSTDPFLDQVLDWGPRDIHYPAQEQQKRRSLVLEMTPLAREAYAQLNGEIILRIDQKYHIREAYGFGKPMLTGFTKLLFRQLIMWTSVFEPLQKTIERTLEDGEIRSSVTINPDGEPMKFVCIPANHEKDADKSVYIFLESHPELTSSNNKDIDDSSLWEIQSYKLKPNHGSATNEWGFYDEPVQTPKPGSVFRIMCVGGSTTWEGPSNKETYPKLLQTCLKELMPGCGIEVLNAGIPGAFANTHLLRFNDYVALQPDMFILHLGVNDTLLQYLSYSVNIIPSKSRFMRVFFPDIAAPDTSTFSRQHYADMGFPLELFIQMALRRGISVVLASIAHPNTEIISSDEEQYFIYQARGEVTLPSLNLSTYVSYINANNHILYQIAEKYGLDYIPVGENLTGGTDIFKDVCHMTPIGINSKAQFFCDVLFRMLSMNLPKNDCKNK